MCTIKYSNNAATEWTYIGAKVCSTHLVIYYCNVCPHKTFGLAVNWPVALHVYTPFSGHRTKHKGQQAGVRGHGIPGGP